MNHTSFMKAIRMYNRDKENKNSTAAILKEKILYSHHTNEEWINLQEELKDFIASNPSQEELDKLQGCGESLAMICSAINEGRI